MDVDYHLLHQAIEKLKSHESLSIEENNVLLELANASVNDYYPSPEELKLQEDRVSKLTIELFENNREMHDRLVTQCTEFENKFL